MSNPWKLIDLAAYEDHMSSDEVYQLQTLNEITKEQLQDKNALMLECSGWLVAMVSIILIF